MANQVPQSQHQNSQRGRSKAWQVMVALLRYGCSVVAYLVSLFTGYLLVRIFVESFSQGGLGDMVLVMPSLFIMIAGTFFMFAVFRFGVGRYLLREPWGTSISKIFLEFILWTVLLVASVYVASDLWFWKVFENICDPLCIYLLP